MVQQIEHTEQQTTEQKNPEQEILEGKVNALKFEIESLEQELEIAKKAKADYAHELMNDPAAQLRRIEQLAAGYATICEFDQDQLSKVTDFINVIRGIEREISDRHRVVEQIQRTIVAQQELKAAQTAIEPKIRNFNQSLAQLRGAWEELRSVASEHQVGCETQLIPGDARLKEKKLQSGFDWIKIHFAG